MPPPVGPLRNPCRQSSADVHLVRASRISLRLSQSPAAKNVPVMTLSASALPRNRRLVIDGPLNRVMADGFDPVAVRVSEEGAVVGGVIFPQARRAVVVAAGCDPRVPERIDLGSRAGL